MSGPAADQDELISQFSELTGCAPSEARQYLEANRGDLAAAAAEYYQSLEEATVEGGHLPDPALDTAENQPSPSPPSPLPPPARSGERTLGGDSAPQPIPTSSRMPDQSSSSSRAPPKKKFATLGDLSGGGSGAHAGHGRDNDSDESDNDPKQDLFAGGEKSGLAVQNPDDIRKKILERARKLVAHASSRFPIAPARRTENLIRNLPRPDDPSAASRLPPTNFSGTAHTLGGDDTPSTTIPGTAQSARSAPPVERILHFWSDGFSVDDGPLYRNDDPANAEILAHIRQGRAPMDILNVERSQEVDVKLDMHEEKYKPPKKKYKPFEGGGQRLGSPTPGDASTASFVQQLPVAADVAPSIPASSASFSSSSSRAPDVDDSQPIISLQIRLGDGTRLVSHFNATHTIGDVYDFVLRSSATQGREFALMTTFPSTELKDRSRVLGDMGEFKRGGTVVQKWI